jgi:glycerol-3-phosphate dehydrogenase
MIHHARSAQRDTRTLDASGIGGRMKRADMIARLEERREPWDMLVIGGGATGMGIAVDAASRGYAVLLLEQHDFGKGTSSRSTKLVHGGVRYLEQGNVALVMEALKERGLLRQNAPHLVSNLAFVVPNYDWWEAPFYGLGLKVYNALAGKYGFGPSEILSREETLARLPTIRIEGLRGGVVYYDGQFDDARLLVNLAQTAAEQGATVLNYLAVTALTKGADGFVDGVVAEDRALDRKWEIGARVVINATGPFSDAVRHMAEPDAPRLIAPSQGIHLVFDQSFLPTDAAIMVPHTSDGRVMFAIPWHGHTLVGTTDTPIDTPALEPRPLDHEIAFILETAGRYLHKAPSREDVLSVFVGIRPLVKSGDSKLTAALSRDHTIHIDASGLITTTGGKWTTYRNMAEHTVDQAADLARLPERACVTRTLNIHGFHSTPARFGPLAFYGSDATAIEDLMRATPALGMRLHHALPYVAAEVVWAVREEMARTVEDVLARRTRALFLNAGAAEAMAPAVARLMGDELNWSDAQRDAEVRAFVALARGYQVSSGETSG